VLPGKTIGLQPNNKSSDRNNNANDLALKNVFDKLFGSKVNSNTQLEDITNGASTTEIKNEIILGALRNILLICEVCKTKRAHMSSTTSTISTPTTKKSRGLPDVTTLPPLGKYY
jgi:hypothetical protein